MKIVQIRNKINDISGVIFIIKIETTYDIFGIISFTGGKLNFLAGFEVNKLKMITYIFELMRQ